MFESLSTNCSQNWSSNDAPLQSHTFNPRSVGGMLVPFHPWSGAFWPPWDLGKLMTVFLIQMACVWWYLYELTYCYANFTSRSPMTPPVRSKTKCWEFQWFPEWSFFIDDRRISSPWIDLSIQHSNALFWAFSDLGSGQGHIRSRDVLWFGSFCLRVHVFRLLYRPDLEKWP